MQRSMGGVTVMVEIHLEPKKFNVKLQVSFGPDPDFSSTIVGFGALTFEWDL